MARWEPDTRGRLLSAAFELFREQGYEKTTVADIATRAGVDKRTFYRLIGDKREALFSGGIEMKKLAAEGITAAPAAAPLAAVLAGYETIRQGLFGEEIRDTARQRQQIVTSTPELQERELAKALDVSQTVVETLLTLGVDPVEAQLAAEAGRSVFHVAFLRWLEGPDSDSFADLLADTASRLRALT